MGLTNSPGLARLVLVELAKQYEDCFPNDKTMLEKNTYMDDSNVLGETEKEVTDTIQELIGCLEFGNFRSEKILTDNRSILHSLRHHPEALYRGLYEAHQAVEHFGKTKNSEDSENGIAPIKGVIGEVLEYSHPIMQDTLLQDVKQLGYTSQSTYNGKKLS